MKSRKENVVNLAIYFAKLTTYKEKNRILSLWSVDKQTKNDNV